MEKMVREIDTDAPTLADATETGTQVVRAETERTRRHMDEVLSRIREELRPLSEAVRATIARDR